MPPTLLLFLLSCGTPAPPEAPAAAPEAGAPAVAPADALPPDPFGQVRALLAPARKEARSDEERDTLLAAWERAYRDVFEPRVEAPLAGRVGSLTDCEYAWGQVLVAVRDHDQRALDRAFAAWDEALARLEEEGRPYLPAAAQPVPVPGGPAPSAYGAPSTVRPQGTPPAATPAKPRGSPGG